MECGTCVVITLLVIVLILIILAKLGGGGRSTSSDVSGGSNRGYAPPTMSERAMAEYTARRCIQLRMALEAYFVNKGIPYRIGGEGTDGIIGNTWFEIGFACIFDRGKIYISMRGYLSRIQSNDPRDIVRWIEDDYPLYAQLSYNDDIIAYNTGGGPMGDYINPILEICNSMSK